MDRIEVRLFFQVLTDGRHPRPAVVLERAGELGLNGQFPPECNLCKASHQSASSIENDPSSSNSSNNNSKNNNLHSIIQYFVNILILHAT